MSPWKSWAELKRWRMIRDAVRVVLKRGKPCAS